MSKKSKIYLLLAGASLIVFASALFLSRDTLAGMIRQYEDEQAAEEYLKLYFIDVTGAETGGIPAEVSPVETEGADASVSREDSVEDPAGEGFTDDRYYQRDGVTYTPDFAEGTLDCVLEIPSIGLQRGVYKGTRSEIDHDLDIWLTTAACPDLELGKTHYAIYGHNHPVQNLSFNRLKDVQPGDSFTLTKGNDVYLYSVSEIFAEWRNVGRKKYAEDLSQDPDVCYIFTCGRDYWPLNGESTRYKDYIVKGVLVKEMSLKEWNEAGKTASGSGSSESPDEDNTKEEKALMKSVLKVTAKPKADSDGFTIFASVKDESGNFIPDARLALMNSDGNAVMSWIQADEPTELTVPEGTWVIGVTEIDKDLYQEPPGKEIVITSKDVEIRRVGEETEEGAISNSGAILTAACLSAAMAVIFLAFFTVSLVKRKRKNR